MTNMIAKSLEDNISPRMNDIFNDLQKQLMLEKGEDEKKGKEGNDSTTGGDLETAGGAVDASGLYKEIGANLEQWDIYRNSVALIESGGRYSAMGGAGDHFDGRYQMGAAAKTDGSKVAGVSNPGHSNDPNAHVRVSYRNNPQLQETIFTGFTIANHRYLMRNAKYKSASVERKLEILGYAHNQGMGGAETWMNTGQVGSDGFGTKGTKYTDLIAKNFRAKKSGGVMELATGAVPTGTDEGGIIAGRPGSFGLSDPTPNSSPGVRGSYGYASDSGLDIMGKVGDSVVAPASGRLLYAEKGHTSWSDDSNPNKPGKQAQHSFLIELSKPFKYGKKTIKYAYGTHLSSLSGAVANKSGVSIRAGQAIGGMGVANNAPHLHLGLLQNRAQASESDWLSNVQVKQVLSGTKAYFRGGRVSIPTFATLAEKGPEFVFDADTTRGLDGMAPLLLEKLNVAKTKPQLASILQSYAGYETGAEEVIEVVIPQSQMVPLPIPMPSGIGGFGGMSAGSSDSSYDSLYAGS